MKKFQAINYLNKQLGKEVLKNSNTNFSNINSRRAVWWMNIKLERLKEDFNILLVGKDELLWLKIPANSFNPLRDFRIWEEKNAIDLYLSSDKNDRYLTDISSGARGVDFKPFLVKMFPFPKELKSLSDKEFNPEPALKSEVISFTSVPTLDPEIQRQRIIEQDEINVSYEDLFASHLKGADNIVLQDPYIRLPHQFNNLLEFCVMVGNNKENGTTVNLQVISWNTKEYRDQSSKCFEELAESLNELGVKLTCRLKNIHDRYIEANNGIKIILGRGLDIFEKREGRFSIGDVDQKWRKCKACEITYINN